MFEKHMLGNDVSDQCRMENASWFKRLLRKLEENWGESDVYRDTPIRYLGYANEVGEAFRVWMPISAVRLSYIIATSYVLADALYKGKKTHKLHKTSDISVLRKESSLTVLDALLWQGFATVILPGLTINRLCKLSTTILKRIERFPNAGIPLLTTAIGLIAIPIIVKPIDALVETGMNATFRKCYEKKHEPSKLENPTLSK